MAKQRPFDTRIGGSTGDNTWLHVCEISVLQCSWLISAVPSKCKEWLYGKNSHVLSMFQIAKLAKFSPNNN